MLFCVTGPVTPLSTTGMRGAYSNGDCYIVGTLRRTSIQRDEWLVFFEGVEAFSLATFEVYA